MPSPYDTLITATDLRSLLATNSPTVVLDCSFDLADPRAGETAYIERRLPGALYVHLERDLSGMRSGRNGRHPLPDRAAWSAAAANFGIGPGVQVVTCDRQGGPYAARAWWLLRWLGHREVAVLDGGLAAWQAAGGAFESGPPPGRPGPAAMAYPNLPAPMPTIDADTLLGRLGSVRLLDARAGERFRGEIEPLDPVAGHIPGARLRFFKDNLAADGTFKPAQQLRAEFDALGADVNDPVVHQCGSGVTACHNLLAMAHAGYGDTVLYPGSWSEWCSDPARPVERG